MIVLKCWIIFAIFAATCYAALEITPTSQKVVVGSPVVFSCVSDVPGNYSWLVGDRDAAQEGVEVRQVGKVAVLRINNAQIKRDKRVYTCAVRRPDGSFEEAHTERLKVLSPNRVHPDYPRVAVGIQSGSHLRISDVTAADGGRYTCVAVNNRGNTYGDTANVNVQIEAPTHCKLDDGEMYKFGETRQRPGDPCTTCTCFEGGLIRCRSVGCVPERCPVDFVFAMSNDTCCKGKCVPRPNKLEAVCRDEDNASMSLSDSYTRRSDPCTTCVCSTLGLQCRSMVCRISPCPPGTRLEQDKSVCCSARCVSDASQLEMCLDRDGRTVLHGEVYMPNEDPCFQCQCVHGSEGRCSSAKCAEPTCTNFTRSRDECCKYTCHTPEQIRVPSGYCRDMNGSFTVPNGDVYTPNRTDPCRTCLCEAGSPVLCADSMCDEPPCPNYNLIPGTCCGFVCLDEESEEVGEVEIDLENMCLDRDGRQVAHGDVYMPNEDPCVQCVCEYGSKGRCASVACASPTCKNYTSSRDVCCKYTCHTPEQNRVPSGYCRDMNGSYTVPNGDVYSPNRTDPCRTCLCEAGSPVRCADIMCDAPPCPNYNLIPGTCCGFVCLDEESEEVEEVEIDLENMCLDRDGRQVAHGDVYMPNEDPCVQCVCEYGSKGRCASVACASPTCKNYTSSRDVCCKYTCHTPEQNRVPSGYCRDMNGSYTVSNGDVYTPNRTDPCRTCLCEAGSPVLCADLMCDEPPCLNYRLIPGTCCGFVCLDEESEEVEEVEIDIENTPVDIKDPIQQEMVLGRVYVRQVGPSGLLVQWTVPVQYEEFADQYANFTVYVRENYGQSMHAYSRPYPAYTRNNNLDLTAALGQVFESRGAVKFGRYSLPRGFEPVARSPSVQNKVNIGAFHRVEISKYEEEPCQQMECGLVRFFMYNQEGECANVMSLLFDNDLDLEWAKAHL
ncbi:KCP-like protein [Mya arenaria]|uniref:KCP-like protein n=1 Tax=Mya arenaria TaxID=6604 RepID=A0ABY7FQ52_MYAAR|nr:KCP-like protein [Mya arenaria]